VGKISNDLKPSKSAMLLIKKDDMISLTDAGKKGSYR
jgi:hypothetical protein